MRGSRMHLPLVVGVVILIGVGLFASRLVGGSNAAQPHTGPKAGGNVNTVARSDGSGAGVGTAGASQAVPTSPSAAGVAAAAAVLPKLSAAQLAGQRVIYSYKGLMPPARLLTLISQGEVAGVIFFTDNFGTSAHFAAVVRQLRQAAASSSNPVRFPLLLMTDQEGGQVRRLPGAPVLSAKQIGQSANPVAAASQAGNSGALNLLGYGLNVNLAPVLDVYRQPGNFIDEFGRSFGSNPALVSRLGAAYAAAEQKVRVGATVKHFPGLGAATVKQNTDVGPVTLRLPLAQIRQVDELPYHAAIAANVKLVMVSWAVYPSLDPAHPAGLSPTIVGNELRKRLGFGGVTITDALEAGALNSYGTWANRTTLAAKAGMDLILCGARNVTEGSIALNALQGGYQNGSLNAAVFKAAVARILALRATLAP